MAENKLEEIIDLLAEYGGFNREYLRDKLLTFANDGRSETKNKMAEVAALFGKKLNEPFYLKAYGRKYRFAKDGLEESCDGKYWYRKPLVFEALMAGRVSIDNDIRRSKEVEIVED